MSDEPLYLIATIKPRMDRADEVVERLRLMRDATRDEPGNISMDLVVGDEADTWFMLEKFTSRAAWEKHMTLAHVTEGNAFLEDKLREFPPLRFYVDR